MSILHDCMERNIKVFTIKEGYELGDNINSKILAFAFSQLFARKTSTVGNRNQT